MEVLAAGALADTFVLPSCGRPEGCGSLQKDLFPEGDGCDPAADAGHTRAVGKAEKERSELDSKQGEERKKEGDRLAGGAPVPHFFSFAG
jgi:hypothetical protein